MNLKQQWCDNSACRDHRKVAAGNIGFYSRAEGRLYCKTCRRTFSADKGTFFETLRSPRAYVVETLAHLGERASLRAVERLRQRPVNTVLDWLDKAGVHTAQVSDQLIQGLHVTYAQVAELWTFVKKTRAPATG
jgi:transposase-like protein